MTMAGRVTRASLKRAAAISVPPASLPKKAQRGSRGATANVTVVSPYFAAAATDVKVEIAAPASRPSGRQQRHASHAASVSSASLSTDERPPRAVRMAVKAEADSAVSTESESAAKLDSVPSTPKNGNGKKGTKLSPRLAPRQPPAGWLDTYNIIQELRIPRDAPVDSMGAEVLAQTPPEVDEKTFRYQVLISLMLSSQTKDQTVHEAIRRLQAHGLTVDNILATPPHKLNELICKVGFHNIKTKNILETTRILKEKHDSDVPDRVEDLLELPGIGPKMAFIILSVAHKQDNGIGIDTHMHRIMNILGWVASKDPEGTRTQLESWLPREHWPHVNVVFVGFGQMLQQERTKLLRRCCLDCSRPVDALRLVFKLGTPPTAQCKTTKQTVLHWAAQRGEPETIAYLLKKTGKQLLDVRDVDGRTPLDLAASQHIRSLLSG